MLLIVGLIAGLVCLYFGGNWLVGGASKLAESLGVSPLVVGLTVVALGTSSPELLVSVGASLGGSPDIAIGNVVGSTVANMGLILGISGLIYPIRVNVQLVKNQIPIMIGIIWLAVFMFQDGTVTRLDGIILVSLLMVYMGFMIYSSRMTQKKTYDIPEEKRPHAPEEVNRMKELGRLVMGIGLLVVGSQLTVDNASELARNMGVSELVIGITVIAVGTSLPELVTSITAALREESDIAIGNVVGSNIFNILAILGVTSLIQPIAVIEQVANFDGLLMLGLAILLSPFVFDRVLGRRESFAFLAIYVVFVSYSVFATG